MTTDFKIIVKQDVMGETPNDNDRCKDFDEDCDGSFCPLKCWLYQPERGLCPLLKDMK